MKTMNKVLAVSILAMLAVPAAHAKIVAETMLSETSGHYSSTHTVQDEIDTKQATISDLSTIRSGAAAGATALQSVTANSDAGVVTNVSKNGTAITMTKAKVAEADLADAVVAKLNSGDSALQAADITTGSTNGTIAVDGTDVAVKGLGSAAYTASTAYATSAQGTKADTALQSVTANSDAGVVTNVSKNGTAITMTKAKIANADVADNAAIAVSKISGAEATANKSTSTSAVADSTGTNKDTKYPTVAGAKAIADAAVSGAAGNYATAAQGAKADTAVQSVTLASGTNNGTVKLTVDGTTTDNIAVKGLGSAAYTASTAYATSAQGTKADTALQSVTANSDAGVVTNVSKNGTAITMTKAKISNADVADNAAIAQSKISGLSTSLSGKVDVAQGTSNKDKVLITNATSGDVETTAFIHASGGSYTAGGDDNDKYIPSVELVEDIVLTAAGESVALHQGDGTNGTTNNKNKAMITDNTGTVVPGQIATGMIADKAVTNAKLSDAVNTSLGLADSSVQSVALASGTNNGTVKLTVNGTTTDNIAVKGLGDAAYKAVGSVASGNTGLVTGGAVYTEVNKKIDKTVSADKNGVIVRNSAGLAMKGTGSDITVSDAGAITVAHATKADQDGSGQNIANTYATKTEVSNNYATKNMELNAVPATPSTEGVYVLTAKITGSGTNATTTYYWEDIGR